MNVTKLKDANTQPDADVIGSLEDALSLAKSGELRNVAICGDLTGNRTFTAFATNDTMKLVALLGFIHHTVCARQRENTE